MNSNTLFQALCSRLPLTRKTAADGLGKDTGTIPALQINQDESVPASQVAGGKSDEDSKAILAAVGSESVEAGGEATNTGTVVSDKTPTGSPVSGDINSPVPADAQATATDGLKDNVKSAAVVTQIDNALAAISAVVPAIEQSHAFKIASLQNRDLDKEMEHVVAHLGTKNASEVAGAYSQYGRQVAVAFLKKAGVEDVQGAEDAEIPAGPDGEVSTQELEEYFAQNPEQTIAVLQAAMDDPSVPAEVKEQIAVAVEEAAAEAGVSPEESAAAPEGGEGKTAAEMPAPDAAAAPAAPAPDAAAAPAAPAAPAATAPDEAAIKQLCMQFLDPNSQMTPEELKQQLVAAGVPDATADEAVAQLVQAKQQEAAAPAAAPAAPAPAPAAAPAAQM